MRTGKFDISEIEYIKAHYANERTENIAKHLDRTVKCIYRKADAMQLKKSAEFLHSPECGRLYKGHNRRDMHQFKKGQIPHNKGKKMPDAVYEKAKATMFKKGQKPHNTKQDGCLSIRKDKSGVEYVYIRISESVWQPLHRVVWEKENGKIPEKYNLVFKDGNQNHIELSNLELLSNAESLQRNSIARFPKELKSIIYLTRKLERTIKNILNNE